MKRNLLYLLPLFLLFILGEACSPKSDPIPVQSLTGTYKGKFKLLVKNGLTSAYDTVKKDTALILKLGATGNFAVTGDTSTVHAGSKGLYDYNTSIIAFVDSTYKAGPQAKFHLAGNYQYGTNGNGALLIVRANNAQDSVLRYELTKISN